jgi:hypothetical protein
MFAIGSLFFIRSWTLKGKEEHRTSNFQRRTLNGKDEETNEIKLQSEATTLFDVQRWAFNVRRSICLMRGVHL